MIYTERKIVINNANSTIDSSILLYRGDRQLEISFEILQSKFKFSNNENLISTSDAAYGQLVINKPDNTKIVSDVAKCDEGKVIFLLTKEMIDDLTEVGFYDIQVRLYDDSKFARISIPPVLKAIEVKEPMMVEDYVTPPEDEPVTFTYDATAQELTITNTNIIYNPQTEELIISGLNLKEE